MKLNINNKAFTFKFETKKKKIRTKSGYVKTKRVLTVEFVRKVNVKEMIKFLIKKICSFILKILAKLLDAIIVQVIMNGLFYKPIILEDKNDFFIRKGKLRWI